MGTRLMGRIKPQGDGHILTFGDDERTYHLQEMPSIEHPGSHEFVVKRGGNMLTYFTMKGPKDASMQDMFLSAMDKASKQLHEQIDDINAGYQRGEVSGLDLARRRDYQGVILSFVIVKNELERDKAKGLNSMENPEEEFSKAVSELSDNGPAPPEQ